jgi:transaldolase
MDIFLDTADLGAVEYWVAQGAFLINGITTNPSLASKTGMRFDELVKRLCSLVEGPVSAEVTEVTAEGMVDQGRKLAKIAENVVIKVPLTVEGLRACHMLSEEEIAVNVTLCFSATQALLAAKAGAVFISPFVGRLDDCGGDGIGLIREIRHIYDNYGFDTRILAASLRHVNHVLEAAKASADVCTIPPTVCRQLYDHSLTDKGLKAFQEDWEKSGLTI